MGQSATEHREVNTYSFERLIQNQIMAELFKILKMYREVESPDIDGIIRDEIPIVSMAKEELLKEGRALSVDLLEVALAGGIDPAPENLCKLLFFAIEVDKGKRKTKKDNNGQESGPSSAGGSQKRVAEEAEKEPKKVKSVSKFCFYYRRYSLLSHVSL